MKKFLLFIVLLEYAFVSCDILLRKDPNDHYYLACENTSLGDVFLSVFSNNVPPEHCPFIAREEFSVIESGKINNYLCPFDRRSYESLIREYGSLLVFIFPSYTNKPVVLDDFKLVCYKLTLDDFIALDFRLSYPPDERMKDMEMSPPYEIFQKD